MGFGDVMGGLGKFAQQLLFGSQQQMPPPYTPGINPKLPHPMQGTMGGGLGAPPNNMLQGLATLLMARAGGKYGGYGAQAMSNQFQQNNNLWYQLALAQQQHQERMAQLQEQRRQHDESLAQTAKYQGSLERYYEGTLAEQRAGREESRRRGEEEARRSDKLIAENRAYAQLPQVQQDMQKAIDALDPSDPDYDKKAQGIVDRYSRMLPGRIGGGLTSHGGTYATQRKSRVTAASEDHAEYLTLKRTGELPFGIDSYAKYAEWKARLSKTGPAPSEIDKELNLYKRANPGVTDQQAAQAVWQNRLRANSKVMTREEFAMSMAKDALEYDRPKSDFGEPKVPLDPMGESKRMKTWVEHFRAVYDSLNPNPVDQKREGRLRAIENLAYEAARQGMTEAQFNEFLRSALSTQEGPAALKNSEELRYAQTRFRSIKQGVPNPMAKPSKPPAKKKREEEEPDEGGAPEKHPLDPRSFLPPLMDALNWPARQILKSITKPGWNQ